VDQTAVGSEDGCGREVESWLRKMRKPAVTPKQPKKPKKPRKPKPPMTLDQLPDACAALVADDLVAVPPVPTQAVPMPELKAPEPERQSSMTRFIKKVMGE
jgi:penicillin-insensitive murein endopeptidase